MNKTRSLIITYISAFLFSFHVALTAYANSSFAETIVSAKFVGLLYGLASLMTLVGLSFLPRLLGNIGNKKSALGLFTASIVVLTLLSNTISPIWGSILFVLYIALNSLIFFALDIFVEHYSDDISTGRTRGLYLLSINMGWVLAPLTAGYILTQGGFSLLYSVGSIIVLGACIVLGLGMKRFKDGVYKRASLVSSFKELSLNPPLRVITSISFILQFFYAWMVIYTPIYLTQHIGFSWETVGIIFTVMLIPFIIIQFPVGLLIDRGWSTGRLIRTGFFITFCALCALLFIETPSIALWALALFFTRVGASIVEISGEIYFFKHTDATNAHLLSVFRNMYPLAYIVAPLLGTLIFFLGGSTETLFIILAVLMIIGIHTTMGLPLQKK